MAKLFPCAVLLIVVFVSTVRADPDMLQDICVADLASTIRVNGFPCRPNSNVTANDFFSAGLKNPGNTNNLVGSVVTGANVLTIPGLNTLGVAMARIDYAVGGINPPHTHPRATEMVFVLEGSLDVGFITTANVLFATTINKGEVFVFPRGLIHFQRNAGNVTASVIAAFNSQLQGTVSVATTLFASTPLVADDILTKAFQINNDQVMDIKKKLAPKT